MNEEIMKVLAMLQEGQITAEQAAQLIEAFGDPASAPAPETDRTVDAGGSAGSKRRNRLRIVVTSPKGDNVNIKIPTRLVTAGVKIGKYFSRHKDGTDDGDGGDLDWDELSTAIRQMVEDNDEGEIMDIVSEKGENVKIWLE